MRTMHLFAGAGGGLLADLILGHQPVVAVEWEPYACQVLRERAADGWFPGLHVYEGDVRLFDPSEYAGSVDCIHAGFPCQDISLAGKQAGVEDGTRSGLYREVLRIAGIVRPRFLFLENVAAILSNGLGTVLADLAALGYDTRWTCLRASEVGANHQRDRWWALARLPNANSADGGNEREEERQGNREMGKRQTEFKHDGLSEYVADTDNINWRIEQQQQSRVGTRTRDEFGGCGEDVADAESERCGETRRLRCDEPEERTACCGEAHPDTIIERLEGQQQARPEARSTDRPGDGCYPGWWQAEPDVGGMGDEFSAWFHENIMTNPISRCKMTASLMECCHEKKTGRTEVLRVLRNGDVTKAIQQSSGRLLSVYETALLLAKLCEYTNEADKARVFVESAETLKTELRGMWLRKEVAGTSHRPGQDQQRPEQHPDAVQTLPRLLAHAGEANGECCGGQDASGTWWEVEPRIGRVADGVPARVHRLKALGNAQCPLQAATAWCLLSEERK